MKVISEKSTLLQENRNTSRVDMGTSIALQRESHGHRACTSQLAHQLSSLHKTASKVHTVQTRGL